MKINKIRMGFNIEVAKRRVALNRVILFLAAAAIVFVACDDSKQSYEAVQYSTGGAGTVPTGGTTVTPTVTGGTGGIVTSGTGGMVTSGTGGIVTAGTGGVLNDASTSNDGGQTPSIDSGVTPTEASTIAEGSVAEGSVGDATAEAAVSAEGSVEGGIPTGECTREKLSATVDAYYAALTANDPSSLPLAATVKYTENGVETQVGQGLWQTVNELKFKRSALDTVTCSTVSESVVVEQRTDEVFGLRLKLVGDELTEIEAIIVRPDDWFPTPQGLLSTADDDWESLLPVDKQPTRDRLQFIVELYFSNFGTGLCDVASDCVRRENGFSPGACTVGVSCGSTEVNTTRPFMETRLTVLDTEAGIAVGFTMFMGAYTDFHLFKVGADDQIHGVHAVLAGSRTSGWD